MNNPKLPWKKAAFTEVVHNRGGGRADLNPSGEPKTTGRSARTERYRYTEWNNGVDGVELYDHRNDPLEHHNLANDPKAAKIVSEMKEVLHGGWQTAKPQEKVR